MRLLLIAVMAVGVVLVLLGVSWQAEVPEGCVPYSELSTSIPDPDGRLSMGFDQFIEIGGVDYWCRDWSWVGD